MVTGYWMVMVKAFFFVLASSCVTFAALIKECPPKESITCTCKNYKNGLYISCFGIDSLKTLQDNLKALRGHSIEELDLRHGKASTLPTDLFQGLHVEYLSLHEFEVQDESFRSGLSHFLGLENSLEALSIIFTDEKSPLNLKLDHLRSLKTFNLQYNKIPELGNNWFTNGPEDFTELYARENGIEKLGDKAFASLKDLKILRLEDNPLKEISRSMLPYPATHLRALYFRSNKIRTLPSDIFSGMPSLVGVDFDDNLIHTLPEDTWSPILSKLYILKLYGNPLRCDQDLKWICDQASSLIKLDMKCTSPVDKKGLTVIDGLCKKN